MKINDHISRSRFWVRKSNRILYFLILAMPFGYFLFWWCFKIPQEPGLHGDEAWIGLRAIDYLKSKPYDLDGMNKYTGNLQSIFSSWSMKFFGKGVAQLRLPGILFNLIALGFISYLCKMLNGRKLFIIFSLILAQFVFCLEMPRVAWEINTFSFLFSVLMLLSFYKTASTIQPVVMHIVIFFLLCLLASYNHILLSCLPVSLFLGLFFWSIANQSLKYERTLILTAMSITNMGILIGLRFGDLEFLSILIVLCSIIFLEIIYLDKLLAINLSFILSYPRSISTIGCIACLTLFTIFHGTSFLELVTNCKQLLHFFSYKCSTVEKIILYATGGLLFIYFVKHLILDAFVQKHICSLIIIAYAGLLNIYTIENSFRYYVVLLLLVALYLSWKISIAVKEHRLLLISLMTSLVVTNFLVYNIYSDDCVVRKPVRFKMGNGKPETSAHFLSVKPLIQRLKKEQILVIEAGNDQFFIDKPLRFYFIMNPWVFIPGKVARVEYDYHTNTQGNGFIIFTRP